MESGKHTPTIDELIGLPTIEDVQISPDGARVTYVVKQPHWEANEYVSQIWLVGVEGDGPRQLTLARRSSASPRWSPDGRWLAFLSKRAGDDHTQVYRISPYGGESERLTACETDIQTIAWSPDGGSIAYIASEPECEAEKERKRTYGEYRVEDQDYTRSHLWLLRLGSKRAEQLTSGNGLHVTDLDWSPEGDRIAFAARPTPDARDWDRARIYVVDLVSLQVTPLTEDGFDRPRWSPDAAQLAVVRYGRPMYRNSEICVLPSTGGEPETISKAFDEKVWLEDWGPDGIYFTAVQRTSIHLFRVEPANRRSVQLTPSDPEGWATTHCSFSRDFVVAALVAGDVAHVSEVVLLGTDDGATLRLTDLTAPTADWRLGRNEVFRWTSVDGTSIEGILTTPDGFDPQRSYPLLVVIHGGPAGTSLLALLSGPGRRYYPIHQWVAKGALVLQPNYRGSTGYGESFRALNVRNLGLGDYEDVISGVNALIARGWVDEERIGAMGWSQGGYISAFLATYCDRFKAVSVGAGISNWVTYYVNTDIHPFTRHYLQSTPWEDAEIYRQTSPITYLERAKTPTLIQHGELDRRVPIPNAYELYQGLQDVGVEVKLVVYKGMPHSITKPRLNRQVMQENLDWFNRWIWGDESPPTPPPPCYVALASADQRPDEGRLRAIDRYVEPHIRDIYHRARCNGADFRIFAPPFGLLEAEELVPSSELSLQASQVSPLVLRVTEQLGEQGLGELVVHTGQDGEPNELIALGCLQVASGLAGKGWVQHHSIID